MDWKTCFQGKKILIAEDDSVNRDLMSDVLTQMQCTFTFAEDGAIAVQKASSEQFDLILMDIRMPNKDGMQATKEIRALPDDKKNVPIVALTASTIEERQALISSGMNEMIKKPIDLEELRQTMAKVLLGQS